MTPIIRGYRAADLAEIYEICLLVGDNGEDASPLYREKKFWRPLRQASCDLLLAGTRDRGGGPKGRLRIHAGRSRHRRFRKAAGAGMVAGTAAALS